MPESVKEIAESKEEEEEDNEGQREFEGQSEKW